MFELRWLEISIPVGFDDNGITTICRKDKKLQFRTVDYAYTDNDGETNSIWNEWQDVPTVNQP